MLSAGDNKRNGFRQIEGLSLPALRQLEEAVAARIKEVEETMRQEGLAELESRAQELGLSSEDLKKHFGGKSSRRRSASSGVVKYRHPETGQSWTGTGRRPNWVKAFEARGGKLEDLVV